MGVALIYADLRTDEQTHEHDEAIRPFSDYKSAPESDTDFFICEIRAISVLNIDLLVYQ